MSPSALSSVRALLISRPPDARFGFPFRNASASFGFENFDSFGTTESTCLPRSRRPFASNAFADAASFGGFSAAN